LNPTEGPKDKPSHFVRTIVVSGLSGSGKTTAIHALEDIGYYCVDNLPVVLFDQVLTLCERASVSNIAMGIDVREGTFLDDYENTLGRIRQAGYEVESVFLDCSDEMVIRRFKETRRRHPLQDDGTISDGIERERHALSDIRFAATHIIDTSELNVHELRRTIQDMFRTTSAGKLLVNFLSFGFKHGLPLEADYVFDVRFLENPYFVESLRPLSGMDEPIRAFLMEQEDTHKLLEHLEGFFTFILPRAEAEGKSQLTVAIGCTGGRHRSVAIVEWIVSRLDGECFDIKTQHRDVERRKQVG
jgi:UPF0042 nucleotide-binding protein